jgi:hypothetical protein
MRPRHLRPSLRNDKMPITFRSRRLHTLRQYFKKLLARQLTPHNKAQAGAGKLTSLRPSTSLQHDMNEPKSRPAPHKGATVTSSSITEAVATNTQPPRASLLGLPKELLNQIILLAVIDDSEDGFLIVHTRPIGTWEDQNCCTSPPTPALARTCTVLEKIVLPVYYGQNTFALGSPSSAHDWLAGKRRGREVAPVRTVYIHLRVRPQYVGEQSAGPSFRKHSMVRVVCDEKTDMLSISASSAFREQLCTSCKHKVAEFVEWGNKYRGAGFEAPDDVIALFAFHLCTFIPVLWNEDGCLLCWQRCGISDRNPVAWNSQW